MEYPFFITITELNVTCFAAIKHQIARIYLFPKYALCWESPPCKVDGVYRRVRPRKVLPFPTKGIEKFAYLGDR